jgi:hypothetical protein
VSDGTFRGRWRDEVFASPLITDAVRVGLLALVPEMSDAGEVSVSREFVAKRINRSNPRVTERLQAGVDAGFLERTVAGKKGRVARYIGRLPETRKDLNREGPPGVDVVPPGGPSDDDHTNREETDVSSCGDALAVEGLFNDPAPNAPVVAKPKAKRPPSQKFAIPADFAVTDGMRAWAAENAPSIDIKLQTQLFVNYFLDKGEKRPGWRRSWESWMLRAESWESKRNNVRELRPNGGNTRYAPGSGSDTPADRGSYRAENFI